jgi:hypothetical protein
MIPLIGFALAAFSLIFGYTTARNFVRTKLRYVDGIQGLKAPVVAGLGAFAIATIPFWLIGGLPFFGVWTAALFGFSVAAGVRAGVKDIGSGRAFIEGP